MAQKTITEKERKENELSEKKNTPFMQVDKHSDPISLPILNVNSKKQRV